MKKYLVAVLLAILIAPRFVFADIVLDIFNPVKQYVILPGLALLFAAALVYFLWGLVLFIWNAENSTKRKEGQQHMMWGIIGIAIMLSAYGIMTLILGVVRGFGPGLHYDEQGNRQDQEVPTPKTLESLQN